MNNDQFRIQCTEKSDADLQSIIDRVTIYSARKREIAREILDSRMSDVKTANMALVAEMLSVLPKDTIGYIRVDPDGTATMMDEVTAAQVLAEKFPPAPPAKKKAGPKK